MLTPRQMEAASHAVATIDVAVLSSLSKKLVADIKSGHYSTDFEIAPNITIGDLHRRHTWERDLYVISLLVSAVAGTLVRIAVTSVGINPMDADWRQMVQLCCVTTHIESLVATELVTSNLH